jgi:LemA protein
MSSLLALIGVGVLVAVLVFVFVVQFNKLRKLNVAVDEGLAQIEVQLQRRYDLVPNLVATVKGYAAHEAQTLQAVTEAREASRQATTAGEMAVADGVLTNALKGLLAVSEAYPELKASASFVQLSEELASTENKIAFARQYYNDSVSQLNTALKVFPSNLFSGAAGVTVREFYEVDSAEARLAPKVEF